ncbi:MAG: radical SAM protein [Alphaproteobacteria bacterium HGW-Alphaproteobacteria-16]|nr:MAG: radical SAM protein [Alphaproteobacteria bacterium HGW-Alphaproteobacteria-16]
MPFIDALRGRTERFDMVSNGHLLDRDKLEHLDGVIHTLIVSFSSIDTEVYRQVHVNLDPERVKENLLQAHRALKHTRLAISLTPMPQCLDTLEATVNWFRRQGIDNLTMSPTLYNRGGNLRAHKIASDRLRGMIKTHRLHSQEMDFVPTLKDIARQNINSRFRCIPRNVDLFIASSGDYLYCYNDMAHQHALGNVATLLIDEALEHRERMPALPSLCDDCNMRRRYGPAEIARVALGYMLRKKAAGSAAASTRGAPHKR